MALVSTFKPKYNVPDLWINPLNGGNFFMYTKNYNKYSKVSISPNALPETIITSRHTYYNFIHIHDFLINYKDTIFQLFYMRLSVRKTRTSRYFNHFVALTC